MRGGEGGLLKDRAVGEWIADVSGDRPAVRDRRFELRRIRVIYTQAVQVQDRSSKGKN